MQAVFYISARSIPLLHIKLFHHWISAPRQRRGTCHENKPAGVPAGALEGAVAHESRPLLPTRSTCVSTHWPVRTRDLPGAGPWGGRAAGCAGEHGGSGASFRGAGLLGPEVLFAEQVTRPRSSGPCFTSSSVMEEGRGRTTGFYSGVVLELRHLYPHHLHLHHLWIFCCFFLGLLPLPLYIWSFLFSFFFLSWF